MGQWFGIFWNMIGCFKSIISTRRERQNPSITGVLQPNSLHDTCTDFLQLYSRMGYPCRCIQPTKAQFNFLSANLKFHSTKNKSPKTNFKEWTCWAEQKVRAQKDIGLNERVWSWAICTQTGIKSNYLTDKEVSSVSNFISP